MEQQIKAAARLYHMRDTAKRFFGKEYQQKIKPYMAIITAYMKENNMDEIKSVMALVQVETNEVSKIMFFAAAVEMVEPSGDGR